jgi:prolyl-tRNA synthetase
MMKDLYTFDYNSSAALETYEAVRAAYTAIFDALKLPYVVADADSGNMGGKLSHEYHFVSLKGEDNVWSCNSCDYVANEELATKRTVDAEEEEDDSYPLVFRGISTDRTTEILIYVPAPSGSISEETPGWESISSYVNLHAVKRALPEDIHLDTGIEASTLSQLLSSPSNPTQTISIVDPSLDIDTSDDDPASSTIPSPTTLIPLSPSDPCPKCSTGQIRPSKAIEVAHTFHLSTRYSRPLNALVSLPDGSSRALIEMGCHGIGVSRLIGAIASLLSDDKGLNWPRVIAPWEVVVLAAPQVDAGEVEDVYDSLRRGGDVDVVLDDREGKGLGWKMRDADLIGYPVLVVLGRGWKERRKVEVQCRRLGVKREVGIEGLRGEVVALLEQL